MVQFVACKRIGRRGKCGGCHGVIIILARLGTVLSRMD